MKAILETPRLIMQELNESDLDFVALMLAHTEVMQYWPRPFTRAESADWIKNQRDRYVKDGFGYWLLMDKEMRQSVGQAGLMTMIVDGVEETGLGYILHRPFWSKGFAIEAALACRDYLFDTLKRDRLIASIRPTNVRSQAVALKIGLKEEKRVDYKGLEHVIFSAQRTVGMGCSS